jgi:uncharacterized protein YeaO (DUF488 family)
MRKKAGYSFCDLLITIQVKQFCLRFSCIHIPQVGAMTISVVRLGSPRAKGEGLRIGTVRRPPRGIRKEDYAALNIYDVWFPNLAPSEALLKTASPPLDETTWRAFSRKFRAEMKQPAARRDLDLLAALSHQLDFAIGCYCKDETRCHRSILRTLLEDRGAALRSTGASRES